MTNGDGEIRTLDPLLARQVLSQLSYTPISIWQVPSLTSSYAFAKCRDTPLTKFELRFLLVLMKCSGSHLLSHIVSNIVPSAAWVLTIVFGMGTGVSPKRIATRNSFGFLLILLSEVRAFITKQCT